MSSNSLIISLSSIDLHANIFLILCSNIDNLELSVTKPISELMYVLGLSLLVVVKKKSFISSGISWIFVEIDKNGSNIKNLKVPSSGTSFGEFGNLWSFKLC